GEDSLVLAVPTFFAVASLGTLVYDHFVHVYWLAAALAWAALAAVIVRMAITFRDNMRILSTARHQAEVDELTGLGNRRRLITDLQQTCLTATPERPFVLIIYDLDGFKNYNDLFGHPAGDSLLTRLAGSLASSLEGLGRAYRMGGDEFCVLAPMPGENARELALSAAAALGARRAVRD